MRSGEVMSKIFVTFVTVLQTVTTLNQLTIMTVLDYFLNLEAEYWDFESHDAPDYFENEGKLKYIFFPSDIEEVVKKYIEDYEINDVAEELSDNDRDDILSNIVDKCISDFGLIRKLYITDDKGNVLWNEENEEPYVD